MNLAPFLLQAFAARMLATKQEATVSRAELLKQGYDVDVLIEMIEAYSALPDDKRGFLVYATAEDITIRRKPNAAAPAVPTLGAAPNSSAKPPAAPAPVATNGHAPAAKPATPSKSPLPRAKRLKPDAK